MVLVDGTDRAGLVTRRASLDTKRPFLRGQLNVEEVAREDVSLKQISIQARLQQFGEKVRVFFANTKWARTLPELSAAFAEDHLLSRTLPRLTPLPGSTLSTVVATAVWHNAIFQARINWTESNDSHLDHYEVRFCPGPNYSTDDESIVASIDPGDPRELLTDVGLETPGLTATYKVYVVTTTGNESGSNAVTVSRDLVAVP